MGDPLQEYVPIRVATLRGDQRINFDVYVRVAGKHILYCRKGDSFDGQRLVRLKEKRIKQLYIASTASGEYRNYLKQNVDVAYFNTSGKPLEVRCQIIKGIQEASTEAVLEDPGSSDAFEVLRADTKKYVEFLLTENDALRGIISQDSANPSVAQHCISVASLAISLANELGVSSTAELEPLAIGCLLHDVEHFHSGLDVSRSMNQFSSEERAKYIDHPENGLARIREMGFYDPLVKKIVMCHHEFNNGTGFPRGLKESDMEPMVMMASVADSYDRLISYEGITPKDAIKKLLIDKVGLHPLPMIQGLASVLKKRGVVSS